MDLAMQGRSKVAVVVGAGPGIGLAVARRFAREGYKVAAICRHPSRIADAVEDMNELVKAQGGRAQGGEVRAFACDCTDEAAAKATFAEIVSAFGQVSVLVYNASGFVRGGICELDVAKFESEWRVSCLGALISLQQVLPGMEAAGVGTIIFTGATASTRGSANFAGFAVGKVGLRTLAESTAREYMPKGVHVSHVIVDGMVNEPKVRKMFPHVDASAMIKPESVAETYWALHSQHPSAWTFELQVRPMTEKW